MLSGNRFLLILICFMIVVLVPWHTETIIPAEIIAHSKQMCISDIKLDQLRSLKSPSPSKLLYADKDSQKVVSVDCAKNPKSCKVLAPKNVELNCKTSVTNGMEIFSGQDAVFFPENDQVNPFHISLNRLQFAKGSAEISGAPLKINQYFEGKIKGLLTIKGERKSLLMRAYAYLFHS